MLEELVFLENLLAETDLILSTRLYTSSYEQLQGVSKEKHGDSGKALQWITRVCALSRAIGYPTLIIALNISVVIVRAYGDLLDPCIVINIVHITVSQFGGLQFIFQGVVSGIVMPFAFETTASDGFSLDFL